MPAERRLIQSVGNSSGKVHLFSQFAALLATETAAITEPVLCQPEGPFSDAAGKTHKLLNFHLDASIGSGGSIKTRRQAFNLPFVALSEL